MKNLSFEVLKNRGDLRAIDLHDIIISTVASKYGLLTRAGVELYNATIDVTIKGLNTSFLSGGLNKQGASVFTDAIFGYLKIYGRNCKRRTTLTTFADSRRPSFAGFI